MRSITEIARDVYCLQVGNLLVNCYVVRCGDGQAFLIDTGDEYDLISASLEELGVTPVAIVTTHGHFDHLGASAGLVRRYKIPLIMHKADVPLLPEVAAWAGFMVDPYEPVCPDTFVNDNEQLILGNRSIQIIHTPGHSPGSISLFVDGILFVGDVLFAGGGYGRTDLHGSYAVLMHSIAKLMEYPDTTLVCPGHGPVSTIGRERDYYR